MGERRLSDDHRVQHRAQGIQVAAPIGATTLDLLGRHEFRRPDDRPGDRQLFGGKHLRHAKVGDLHRAVLRNQQIGRLQVAVNDPHIVRMLQPRTDLHRDLDRLLPRNPPVATQSPGQRVAFHVFHRVVVGLVVIRPALEELDDVGVVQLLECFDLAMEPQDETIFPGQRCRQHLDRRALAGLLMRADIHRPHRASADLAVDQVRSNTGGMHDRKLGRDFERTCGHILRCGT